MTEVNFKRHLEFDSIYNFRDLGGYRTRSGARIAWRKVFRSGDLCRMSHRDIHRLKTMIGLRSVIDLRTAQELVQQGNGHLKLTDIKYHHVPLMTGNPNKQEEEKLLNSFSNMGEVYLYYIQDPEYGRKIMEALKIIATPANHPLVFHCAVGKDRTGILAAILLSVLDVPDEDIIADYALTEKIMASLFQRWRNDSQLSEELRKMPDFFWRASPESMSLFLSTLERRYGSVRNYLIEHNADQILFEKLRDTLVC